MIATNLPADYRPKLNPHWRRSSRMSPSGRRKPRNSLSKAENWCLDRIRRGLLRFRRDGEIESFHVGRQRWTTLSRRQYKGRWKYEMGNKQNGSRGPVYRNRLVWMLIHRRAIPRGFHVDHRNLNREDDSPENLRLMKAKTSNRQGHSLQKDRFFQEVADFFDSKAPTDYSGDF